LNGLFATWAKEMDEIKTAIKNGVSFMVYINLGLI
jgi:hypothetical protein